MLTTIIHTMDSYRWVWDPWLFYFNKNWDRKISPVYFCNENIDVNFITDINIQQIKTGSGQWSDRLIKALENINTAYIFYLQEDFFIQKTLSNDLIMKIIGLMKQHDIKRFGIYTKGRNLETIKTGVMIEDKRVEVFTRNSPYLISHQPSIWNRKFFLKCLKNNETPWTNEIEGTERLRKNNPLPRICMIHMDWYKHTVKRGIPKPIWYELQKRDGWKMKK